MKSLKILFLFVMTFAANEESLVADQTNSLKNSETSNWKSWQIPEYNLEFKYPPEAGVKESKSIFSEHPAVAGVSRIPDGLPGETDIDGLNQLPFIIYLNTEFTRASIDGVISRFPIRFIMLTDAAKLDPKWAKKYHWTEKPTISMYPFNFNRDKDALLTAIERLFLERPKSWSEVKPITVDGKAGVDMSTWDYILGNSGEKFFHEIVAVPVSTNKISIIQAGYYRAKSNKDLESRRQIFSNVVSSVKFLEKQ